MGLLEKPPLITTNTAQKLVSFFSKTAAPPLKDRYEADLRERIVTLLLRRTKIANFYGAVEMLLDLTFSRIVTIHKKKNVAQKDRSARTH